VLQKPERERESMGKRERGEESLWNEEEDTWYEEENTKYPGGGFQVSSSSLPSILLLTPRIIEALLCPLVLFYREHIL